MRKHASHLQSAVEECHDTASENTPVWLRIRNPLAINVRITASHVAALKPKSRSAWDAVSRRPGISRYSARTRQTRSDGGLLSPTKDTMPSSGQPYALMRDCRRAQRGIQCSEKQ